MVLAFLLCWLIADTSVKPLDEEFSFLSLAQKTIRLIIEDKRQLFLVPITVFTGNSLSFVADTFTFSFITCGFGPEWIGAIMIAFGTSGAITSISLGFLKQKIDRICIISTGFVLQTVTLALMLGGVIYPNPQHIGRL